jgi:hypothetical protein
MDDYIYSQSVHKDFHGILNYLIKFIRENHGEKHLKSFFTESAAYVYRPLIRRIKDNGLIEMKKHLEKTFKMEDGEFDLKFNNNRITFIVKKCPAIWFMKDKRIEIDKDFCKYSTEAVNKSMAGECGYNFKVTYIQEKGSCIQEYWKEEKNDICE